MADYIEQAIKATKLDKLDSNQSLAFVNEKTGLRPSQLAFAIIVFLTVILIIAEASAFVVAITCFLFPAYFSFLSLESHDKKDDIKYLTYWVVFALSQVISPLFLWMLGGTIYTSVRVAFTIALLHPQINLAQKIYYSLVSPYLGKHQKSIDKKFNELTEKGHDKFDEIAKRGQRQFNDLLKKAD